LPCNLNGFSSLPGRSEMNCTQCKRGYYRQTTRNACTSCPHNTSIHAIGGFECTACPPGSTSAKRSISCTCRAPMIMKNYSACVCNAGFFGMSGCPCSACPAGKYRNVTGLPVACPLCPANTYSEPAQSLCVCNAGYFAALESSMSFLSCPNRT
jgi:hypothetical protein